MRPAACAGSVGCKLLNFFVRQQEAQSQSMEAPSPVGVTPNRRLMILAIACLLAAYVGAYVCMSRRGYAEADRWDGAGFYYFTPENSDSWRRWN